MQALKDKIRAEGKYLGDGILKIDSILNHQMDPRLIRAMGEEIARRYRDARPTRILTAEVSGIAPAHERPPGAPVPGLLPPPGYQTRSRLVGGHRLQLVASAPHLTAALAGTAG